MTTFLKDNKIQPGIRYKELPDKKICIDYQKGITVVKLAKKYNSNAKTIRSRLHKNNICSLTSKVSEKEIIHGIEAKIEHYNECANFNDEYKVLRNKFLIMKNKNNDKLWLSNFKKKYKA